MRVCGIWEFSGTEGRVVWIVFSLIDSALLVCLCVHVYVCMYVHTCEVCQMFLM